MLACLSLLSGCDLPYIEDTDDDLGLDALRRRLGAQQMPTGRGVRLALVEANTAKAKAAEAPAAGAAGDVIEQDASGPCRYVPDGTRSGLQGKTITDRSGQTHPPRATSSHANGMARLICARGGIAPGIREIDAYFSQHWLVQGPLRGFQPQPPQRIAARVMNHSWIAAKLADKKALNLTGDRLAAEYLRRADHVIDRDGLTMVVGVNNGRDAALPALLAHAYNAISVGVSSGSSSVGPTKISSEVPGRCKPDIVCPAHTTSAATAKVTAAVALLLETADAHADAVQAARPETIKAVLLAGATRGEEEFQEPWPRDAAQPLDFRRGAGEVNINNSHLILAAKRRPPVDNDNAETNDDDDVMPPTGWDYGEVEAGETRHYRLHVPAGHRNEALSIALVWHRQVLIGSIDPDRPAMVLPVPLAQLDLRLFRLEGEAEKTLVEASISPIDNVEHLLIEHPTAGDYVIEVSCASGQAPFALAWQTRGADAPTWSVAVQYALMYSTLLLAAIVFYVWRKRRARRACGIIAP